MGDHGLLRWWVQLVEWLSVRNKMIIKRTINGESQSKKLITWRWLLQIREKGRTQNGEGGNKVNASENSTHLNAGYGSSQLQTSVKPDFVQDPEIEFQTGFFFPFSQSIRFASGFRAGSARVQRGYEAGSTQAPRGLHARSVRFSNRDTRGRFCSHSQGR